MPSAVLNYPKIALNGTPMYKEYVYSTCTVIFMAVAFGLIPLMCDKIMGVQL